MSPHADNEDQLVEPPSIALFDEIGWEAVNCFLEFEQAGGSPLGRETPAEAITKAIEELRVCG